MLTKLYTLKNIYISTHKKAVWFSTEYLSQDVHYKVSECTRIFLTTQLTFSVWSEGQTAATEAFPVDEKTWQAFSSLTHLIPPHLNTNCISIFQEATTRIVSVNMHSGSGVNNVALPTSPEKVLTVQIHQCFQNTQWSYIARPISKKCLDNTLIL